MTAIVGRDEGHANEPRSWLTIRDEVGAALSAVSADQMDALAALFEDRDRRWFCAGQGRSGLVAQMAAMRLMHLGFDAHAVGLATAPSVARGDGIVVISGTGETPISVHVAEQALGFGALLVAVSTNGSSTLAKLADTVVVVPASSSSQFGGSLFEQAALLLFDALVLDLTARDPEAYARMAARHTNLQ